MCRGLTKRLTAPKYLTAPKRLTAPKYSIIFFDVKCCGAHMFIIHTIQNEHYHIPVQ